MSLERLYTSVRVGDTALNRRVVTGAAAATPAPTNPPPAEGVSTSDGERCENFTYLRPICKLSAGATATIVLWVWSEISKSWHTLATFNATDKNEALPAQFNSFQGVYVQVSAIAGGSIDVWVQTEPMWKTQGNTPLGAW